MGTAYDTAIKQAEPEQDRVASVAVEDLRKTFGSHNVLNGVSLSVRRGETLAVLGRSGTGKSVLLRIVIGLETPDSGSVRIHGQDIAGLALDRMGEIRKKMGFLFQQAALYDSLTVAGNVAFPLEHHRRDMSRSERTDRVEQLLVEVGMEADWIRCLPKFPAECRSAWAWRARLRWSRRFCFSTSRRRDWIRSVQGR